MVLIVERIPCPPLRDGFRNSCDEARASGGQTVSLAGSVRPRQVYFNQIKDPSPNPIALIWFQQWKRFRLLLW